MSHSMNAGLACLATGLLGLALPQPTLAAARAHDSSAGGSCHSASPTPKFTRNNHFTTNIAATDQYLVCQFQMDDDPEALATDITDLQVDVTAGATSGTVTCVAQVGSFYGGVQHVETSQTRSAALTAGNSATLDFDPLIRSTDYNVLTMNCKVPGGFKVGLIAWSEG